MLAHEIDRGAVDWAGLRVSGAERADLDPLEFERLRQMVGNAGGGADSPLGILSDREIASALGFTRHGVEVTTGALLLLGKVDALRRFLPTYEAAFQVLRGLAVEVNDFLPYPLLRLAEEMLTRFRARNTEEEVDFGLLRVAVFAPSSRNGAAGKAARRALRTGRAPLARAAHAREPGRAGNIMT
jgi:ATP-dependent DNA helicase RecG